MAPPEISPGSGNANGTPAGYGRSCTNCSRAKCKCILRLEGGSCERCHRLGKDCQPMTTLRKRISKKSSSSRTAQLEEKLDDLVSILRASQQPGQQSSPPVLPGLTAGAFTSRLDSLATAATAAPPHPPACAMSPSPGAAKGAVGDDLVGFPEPTWQEAEDSLVRFRQWLQNWPFLYLPPETTARQLKDEKPFLWLCIMNMTSLSGRQQRILRARVRRELAEKMIINFERDVDMLQGLMAYLAWATMIISSAPKPFLLSYAHLAITIFHDLAWSWSPSEELRFNNHFKMVKPGVPSPRVCTMEERRSVISLWYIVSVYAGLLGKIEPLRWSSHMQECLEVLEQDPEHPQDEVLVALVKVQLVGSEAQTLMLRDVISDKPSQAPSFVFRKGMVSQLEAIRRNLPMTLSTHAALQAHIISTECLIHLPSVLKRDSADPQRLDSIYSFLKASRSWLDVFFAIPVTDIPGLPFSFFVDLFKAQVGLCKLGTIDEPDWDKKILHNMASPLVIIDQTIEKLQQVNAVYGVQAEDEDDPLFIRAGRTLRSIRSTWEPLLSQHINGLPTPSSQSITNSDIYQSHVQQAANAMMTDPSTAEFQDLAWMSDILEPWEF